MRIRRLVLLLAVTALPGCGAARAAAPRETLPPDSVELLRRALERARPAFQTQAEALRSGVYDRAAPTADTPARRADPPRPATPAGSQTDPSRRPPPPPADRPERSERPERPERPRPEAPEVGSHRFGIQIAAFRDGPSAEIAAVEARRSFPELTVSASEAEGWFRVIVAGWAAESDAVAALPAVRSRYPSAWVRRLSVP